MDGLASQVSAFVAAVVAVVGVFYKILVDRRKVNVETEATAVTTALSIATALRAELDTLRRHLDDVEARFSSEIQRLEAENAQLRDEVDDVLIIGSDLILQMMRAGIKPDVHHLPDRYREILTRRARLMTPEPEED